MKKTLCHFMDNLPIVCLVQGAAVLVFVFGLPHLLDVILQYKGGNILSMDAVEHIGMVITSLVYSPLVLLALAEIIKILKNKNARD